MPKDFELIRQKRPDLTDYLIHWTKARPAGGDAPYVPAIDVLKEILACGYLKPTHGYRNEKETVRGEVPAVCFTEQPLDAFLTSCSELSSRYQPYGVAVNRLHLYNYGGRPVLYADNRYIDALSDDMKYLGAFFDPNLRQQGSFTGYPEGDFTHEREWRCVFSESQNQGIGLYATGVPLLLPYAFNSDLRGDTSGDPAFKVIVATMAEKAEVRGWINGLSSDWRDKQNKAYVRSGLYYQEYFSRLPRAQIIATEEVKRHIQAGENEWGKIETVPDASAR